MANKRDINVTEDTPKLRTGIAGLDTVLNGGLPAQRLYLVQGEPGVGKTTVGLQFLLTGVQHGERGLYVTLSESRDELIAVARSHGWSLDTIEVVELGTPQEDAKGDQQYTIFHPSEIELGSVVKRVIAEVERVKPARVIIDSLSELRLLAGEPLRYRRQILTLKDAFQRCKCTTLLLDSTGAENAAMEFETLAHGVIALDAFVPPYGRKRRRVRVAKMRGVSIDDGFHDFQIRTGGIEVYPRLVAADHRLYSPQERVESNIKELDQMLGGGLTRGSSTLIMGAAGTGKSTFCMQYAVAAAERGERAALFCFDETREMIVARANGMGVPLEQHLKSGRITIQTVDPGELAPGEFIDTVRNIVDREQVGVVVIDSLNGYLHAAPDERFLTVQLHELLTYMNDRVVLTLVVVAQNGLFGTMLDAPVEISYLADAVILLRYFEHAGCVRQAISVVKKRYGTHERNVRELSLGRGGIMVGEPLRQFQGVMSGMPTYIGGAESLFGGDHGNRRG